MWSSLVFGVILYGRLVVCDEQTEKIITTSQGPVKGYKDATEDIFMFYEIPYATAPTGENRFKAPLPAPTWLSPREAIKKNIACPQFLMPIMPGNLSIQEDCLVANVYVPDTEGKNLSVVVYVHGGAFQMGYGDLLAPKKFVASKQMIVVTFNYRLGIHGFLCLGTDDAPGNAGMKDQVALLRWVKKNIASFGGNPEDVTIAGYSAGSASVDLLMLSPSTKGLFNKVIPESGANLAAFSVQVDPLASAREFARRFNVTDIYDVYSLEKFYKTASFETLTSDPFMDRKDSTFSFSPCVERKTKEEPFLSDSPYNILKNGNYEKLPMLYGFADMEGLLRIDMFEMWKDAMNNKFSDVLPPDLQFGDASEKERVAAEIKEFYFGDKPVCEDTVLAYVDYFSDVLFTYSTLKAVKLHAEAGNDKIYLYEYSFYDDMTPAVPHTDNVKGSNHCGQTIAVFDGIFTTKDENDLTEDLKTMKILMRELWTNFVKTGSPVPEGSSLPSWPATAGDGSPYMSLGRTIELRDSALLEKRRRMWDDVYDKYYRAPMPPPAPVRHTEL